ncbi:MAG: hypothetical protein DCC58_08290 [Chloroflexi bacterium]|nr:MAG: hypothetical protein DCC58_08290 [Chloroflexota bacterium]
MPAPAGSASLPKPTRGVPCARRQPQGADPLLYTRPEWWWLALLAPGAIVLSALASAIPARRATGVAPAEVLRYE